MSCKISKFLLNLGVVELIENSLLLILFSTFHVRLLLSIIGNPSSDVNPRNLPFFKTQPLLVLFPDAASILKISLPTLVNDCLNFKNKNLILFDLETLGFHPTFDYEQIIEIAAMCVRGETLESYDKFERKIILSESAKKLIDCSDSVERYNWEKRQKRRGKQ